MTEKRRHKGEGSIQQLPNGTFKAVITLPKVNPGNKDEKQRRKSFTGKSSGEVIKKMKEFDKNLNNGKVSLKGLQETVEEFTEKWLATKKRSVRGSTYRMYESSARININPRIGSKTFDKITSDTIDNLVETWMEEDGLSAGSVETLRVILRNIFSVAEEKGLIIKNPVGRSSVVKVEEKDVNTLSQDEAQRVLRWAKGNGKPPIYHLLLLALSSGMRRGELLALPWENVTDTGVRVWKNLVQTKDGVEVLTPKTVSGRRTISIAPWVLAELETLRVEGEVLVFNFGPLESAFSALRWEWQKVLQGAEVKGVRFHDLRHTHATQLIGMGVDIKTVSKRLGHKNIKTTLDLYAHWMPEKDQEAAVMMGEWLTEGENKNSPEGS